MESCRSLPATSFLLAVCLAFSSALKVEAVCSSETLLNFYRSKRHIPEESTAVTASNSTRRMQLGTIARRARSVGDVRVAVFLFMHLIRVENIYHLPASPEHCSVIQRPRHRQKYCFLSLPSK
jgi:hypothetical protein